MSRDIENSPQTHRATGPSFPSRKIPLVPALVVGGGTLVALFVWTLPNWEFFAQNVARFSALWQIEATRRAISILVIKVCSPVLLGSLLAACCWLWYLIKPFLQEDAPTLERTRSNQVSYRHPPQTPVTQATASQNGWSPNVPSTSATATSAAQFVSQHATNERPPGPEKSFPLLNSETPLPSTLDQMPQVERRPQNNGQDLWGNGASCRRGEVSTHAAVLLESHHQRDHGTNEGQQAKAEREQELHPTSFAPTGQQANVGDAETEEAGEQGTPALSPTLPPQMGEQRPYRVSITLLKKVGMTLMTAQGISRDVPLSLNAKRVQLLAYLAWLRGQPINRDRMLEQVFGHGKDDEEATREKLGEAFDSHKKLIRWDLREAINQLNAEAGGELIPPDLDIFSHKQRLYWLSEVCHVADLEEIEMQHKVIELARKDGMLVDQVPDDVKKACDQLMTAYTGDFLEELVTDYLDDFEPWVSSWARKPYTLFRDYYLQALWYAAEYGLRQGQQFSDGRLDIDSEAKRKEQRKHWGQAAQHYRTYAMGACNSRFDMKVTFGSGGREHGERVIMSERALRRSLVLYGSIGATHQVDQVYSAYYKQMRSISAKAWEPSKATLTDLRSAKEQTNAYRFPNQVTPHEPLPSMDNHLETSA